MAAQAPLSIAGGDLDPAFPHADIYVGTPKAATPPPGRACAVAARYVELVNAGEYAAVAALYADDATFLEPVRPSLKGRAQIEEFYVSRIGAMKPRIVPVSYLGDDRECMVLLAVGVPIAGETRFMAISIDHFVLAEDGRIASMTAFVRPPSPYLGG